MTLTGGAAIFSEKQRFLQLWVWIVVVLLAVGVWVLGLLQLVFDRPENPEALSDVIAAVSLVLVGIGIPVLLLLMKLETEVRKDGLYVRFFPFHLKPRKFAWTDIRESRARDYSPLREYGGWGIRWGRGGRAYNVRGNRGLQLVLKDGKRWLIGSQQADRLAAAVAGAMENAARGVSR